MVVLKFMEIVSFFNYYYFFFWVAMILRSQPSS